MKYAVCLSVLCLFGAAWAAEADKPDGADQQTDVSEQHKKKNRDDADSKEKNKNNDKAQIKETTMPLKRSMKSIDGKDVQLDEHYQGKVLLVVNVASKCGLTPQYKDLEKLYQDKKAGGFRIAAFPCNQFGKQEPGTSDEIKSFCQKNYGVSFDLYEKIEVNGDGACGLYKILTATDTKPTGSGKIAWNFEKFLIGKDGQVIARFGPKTAPDDKDLVAAIDKALTAE